jgi:hypothetical protein
MEYRLAQGRTSLSRRRQDRAATARGRILVRVGVELPQGAAGDLPPGALAVVRGEACSEGLAQLVWDGVRLEAPGRHRQLLQRGIFFSGPELFELLSRRSPFCSGSNSIGIEDGRRRCFPIWRRSERFLRLKLSPIAISSSASIRNTLSLF